MPGKRAVAGFAIHARVLAGFLYFQNVAVAVFTTLVAGIGDRLGGELGQRVSAIVAVLSKALGDEVGSQQKKQGDPNCESCRQPEEMFGILESVHAHPVQNRVPSFWAALNGSHCYSKPWQRTVMPRT